MTDTEIRAAAVAAIDAMLARAETLPAIRAELKAEAERVERMIAARDAGETTYLTIGDLKHTEAKFPVLGNHSLWMLVSRGADLLAGSVIDGYALRHPELAGRLRRRDHR